MSTIEAPGITLDLDGPLPVARRFSLEATPGVVVERASEDEDPRWMSGVNVIGYPDGTPATWEPCVTGTSRVKEEGEDQPSGRFDPIAVYFALHCTARGMSNAQSDKFANRATLALDATLSHGIEEALARGVFMGDNPSFGDANMDPLLGGVAVSPQTGLAALENAIGQTTGRQGLIHATPAVVAAWGYGDAINPSNDPVNEGPSVLGLRSPNGTPVISGSGYVGTHPLGPGGLEGPGDTTDWVFATGPVEVRIGGGPRVDITESLDRSINYFVFRPERFVLAEWDTALQVGVLIDWSL